MTGWVLMSKSLYMTGDSWLKIMNGTTSPSMVSPPSELTKCRVSTGGMNLKWDKNCCHGCAYSSDHCLSWHINMQLEQIAIVSSTHTHMQHTGHTRVQAAYNYPHTIIHCTRQQVYPSLASKQSHHGKRSWHGRQGGFELQTLESWICCLNH